ncbi:hypothetical protein MKZ38_008894 [Zalerion maritima]|uniref:DUF3752 domain-containing protein n=1 Tax=Zalerion maritima TaxID=339359 RepID=A0AAD5WVZ5_9PEZI|nr:hypothetical protein MKZ38_008894 [Zalerion maritima]
MSSIGPQLPPHLTKRKRTPEDEESASSPPAKKHVPASESDSDSVIGPAALSTIGPSAPIQAPSIGPSMPPLASPSIGPTIPPSVGPSLPSQIPGSDSDSDWPGPTPAPRPGPTLPPKRTLGPSLPPPGTSSHPPAAPDSDSDSDSDYGPSLPTSNSHARLAAQSSRLSSLSSYSTSSSAPKRDDWMLAPPSAPSSGLRESDPTRLRNRKFASGPRAATTVPPPGSGAPGEISSLWTETAHEKAKRVADSVLGRSSNPAHPSAHSTSKTTDSGGRSNNITGTSSKSLSAKEEARVRESINAARGPSLMSSHAKTHAKKIKEEEEKDDPSKRAFDREKDMSIGCRGLGGREKSEVFRQARDFGGRFGKGSFL